MNIGTKSILFGAHCFFLHPWFIARAWWKLYGFPWDPRLWVAFFVHDLGYWGKPNMDGPEGEKHPFFGARVMTWLFDPGHRHRFISRPAHLRVGGWGMFTLLHSRYLAKALRYQPSKLCAADKLAIALTPSWLYLPMVNWTGEIAEYMKLAEARLVHEKLTDAEKQLVVSSHQRQWHKGVQDYCRRWAYEHADGKVDTWTGDKKELQDKQGGVWK